MLKLLFVGTVTVCMLSLMEVTVFYNIGFPKDCCLVVYVLIMSNRPVGQREWQQVYGQDR